MDKIKAEIITLLKDLNEDLDYENETHLISNGLIDSMQVMMLISDIFDVLNVEIDAVDISMENFNSVNNIVNIVKKYK